LVVMESMVSAAVFGAVVTLVGAAVDLALTGVGGGLNLLGRRTPATRPSRPTTGSGRRRYHRLTQRSDPRPGSLGCPWKPLRASCGSAPTHSRTGPGRTRRKLKVLGLHSSHRSHPTMVQGQSPFSDRDPTQSDFVPPRAMPEPTWPGTCRRKSQRGYTAAGSLVTRHRSFRPSCCELPVG
jgi:hypothetical protein